MIWKIKEGIPLDLEQFEYAYYWAKHDGIWFIVQFWPKEQEFYMAGQPYGFSPTEFDEIECEKIQQPEHLTNWVYKKRT